MPDTAKRSKRWLQFSISGLLAITTLAALLVAWYGDHYALRVELERQRAIAEERAVIAEFERSRAELAAKKAQVQIQVGKIEQKRLMMEIQELRAKIKSLTNADDEAADNE